MIGSTNWVLIKQPDFNLKSGFSLCLNRCRMAALIWEKSK